MDLVPAVVGGLRPALREGGASSSGEPIAFVFICRTRQELFTQKQDSWSLLKLLTPRAWSRPGSITDSGSLECGALLRSFYLKGRTYRTRPWGLPVGLQRSPLYIPIISLNKLRCSKAIPAFSTAGTKQTAELQNPGVCSVLSAQPWASGRSLPLSSVGTCRHLPWCSLRKPPFWCPSRFSWDNRLSPLRFGSTISYAIESSPMRRLLKTHFPIWTLSWAQRVVGLCFPGSCFLPWGF